MYVYMYVYIYIYRERERYRYTHIVYTYGCPRSCESTHWTALTRRECCSKATMKYEIAPDIPWPFMKCCNINHVIEMM